MKNSSRVIGVLVVLVTILFAANGYSDHAQYYVLDGFGGVHAGGGAAAVGPGIPYFGFDIAKGIAYVPGLTGDGILVLDGFGGVHNVGLGNVAPATPYFGFDVARAITSRNIPPRVANNAATTAIDISVASAAFQVISSTTINAPDDGFILAIGTTFLSCLTSGSDLSAHVSINVDSTAEPAAIANMGYATWDDCTAGGGIQNTSNQTVTHLFPVTAGAHTVNFLGRKQGGTGTARFLGRSITAVFVDLGATGTTAPTVGEDVSNAARAIGR